MKQNCIFSNLEAIREFDQGEIHEDASLKCYMYCVFEVLELINDKGQLFIMKLADHIESNYDDEVQNIAFQMGRRCLRPPEDENNCEKAFYYHKCWKTRDPVVCFVHFNFIHIVLKFNFIFVSALFPDLSLFR